MSTTASIPGPSTPIVPSSKAPAPIPRTPSSTMPHPSASTSGNSNNNTSSSSYTAAGSAGSVSTLRRTSIYDKNLHRKTGQVALSSFSFLYSEMIQYMQKQASGIQDLEQRLNRLGYHIGLRLSELVTLREGKNAKREIKLLSVLQFVYTTVWKTIFGKPADALEKSHENSNEYMIIDHSPLITHFISIPKDMSQLNCSALSAGIIEAILDGYLFTAKVTAHTVETEEHPNRTVFLIKFDPNVIEREELTR